VQSHKANAHALKESDRAIVSMNQTNKEERSSAEPGEKRARAKENIVDTERGTSVPGITASLMSSCAEFAQTFHVREYLLLPPYVRDVR
jgi:hypothetical protein